MSRKATPASQPSWPTLPSLRTTLIALAVVLFIVLLVLGYRALSPSSPEAVADGLAAGKAVKLHHHEGTDDVRVMVYRMMHGGETTFDEMVEDAGALRAFLTHHDNLTEIHKGLVREHGADKLRVYIEGYNDQEQIVREMRQVAATLRQMESKVKPVFNARASDPAAFKEIRSFLRFGGPETMRLFMFQGRFPLYLVTDQITDAERICIGADIKGRKALTAEYQERLLKLVKSREEPDDAAIQAFCTWAKAASDEDNRVRHEHLAEKIAKLPPGSIVSIVMGGSHSRYGERMEKSLPVLPLEDAILARRDVHLTVYEEENYGRLIRFGLSGKFILAADTPPDEVKLAVKAMREDNKK